MFDASKSSLERCTSLPLNIEAAEVLDLSTAENLEKAMKGADLVIETLPGSLGFKAMEVASRLCIDMVSTSYTPEDPLPLDESFRRCGRTLVPDAGIAPGLSNIIAGRIATILDTVEDLKIVVGGLPEEPWGPLAYVATWSVEDLLEEYTRPARVVRDHQIVEVDPLSTILRIEVPTLGSFEAFYSDGLRTMLKTLRSKVRNAAELTIRYSGHLEKIKLLRDLGFLSSEMIELEGVKVPIRKVVAKILEKSLRAPNVKDVVVLYVEGRGTVHGVERAYRYLVVVRYDGERALSAMAKATGFTAYTIAKLVAKHRLRSGVVPPEEIGFDEGLFTEVLSELVSKGFEVSVIP